MDHLSIFVFFGFLKKCIVMDKYRSLQAQTINKAS